MAEGKKRILIINGRYLPGYKDGGPVRSIKNLTDALGDEYDFRILTCDRDHGDDAPYPDIKVGDWNKVDKALVYYVSPGGFRASLIKKLSSEVDLVYVCGCFSDYSIHTLLLKRMGKIHCPVVVASMGLFSPLEFRIKHAKKKLFTTVFKLIGAFKNIYWSATSQMEISAIRREIPTSIERFFVAEDLPRLVDGSPIIKEKEAGCLNVVWISRIAHNKNLLFAIKILQHIKSNISFTIYGPIHDVEYWQGCQEKLKKLPLNVTWSYCGNVESEEVVPTLRKHHVFLFPTMCENYGHVIHEALSAGCPTIISDQTPWQDLEAKGVGYVYSLEAIQPFVNAIEHYAQMSAEEYNACANRAISYAKDSSNEKAKNTGYRTIFDTL